MRKPGLILLTVCLLISLFGCSSSSGARSRILRETRLGTKYQMYQLEITLPAGTSIPIILNIEEGETVGGYFYLVRGDESLAFKISGTSTFYRSDFTDLAADTPVSDRFSFAASDTQGVTYTLEISNTDDSDKNTKSVVFLEVIYAGDSPIFTPLGSE